ncbi:MAG: hypothetical protein IKN06_00155 [Bacteroidales bacterium]|nr:hypothetical protein [Bacteroidales bacterium]
MVGKMIHLVFRQNLVTREMVLMTPHASWEGAIDNIKRHADYYREKGYSVIDRKDGVVDVSSSNGAFHSLFFISSRTVEK